MECWFEKLLWTIQSDLWTNYGLWVVEWELLRTRTDSVDSRTVLSNSVWSVKESLLVNGLLTTKLCELWVIPSDLWMIHYWIKDSIVCWFLDLLWVIQSVLWMNYLWFSWLENCEQIILLFFLNQFSQFTTKIWLKRTVLFWVRITSILKPTESFLKCVLYYVRLLESKPSILASLAPCCATGMFVFTLAVTTKTNTKGNCYYSGCDDPALGAGATFGPVEGVITGHRRTCDRESPLHQMHGHMTCALRKSWHPFISTGQLG